ncbi:MAG: sugar phosphate isomerase/epimerase family protein [Bacillota bacterium]|nr:sugar phosphate isomerase/epimerase family protein [Bacillota bacterium]
MYAKLAFSTLGCPELSFPEITALARANGIRGLEIRGLGGRMKPDEIAELSADGWPATRELLQESGLELVGFGSSVRFDDAAGLDAAFAEGRAAIALARRCQIPYIRVFGDRLPDEPQDWPAVQRRVADGLVTLAAEAAAAGVTIILEVHGSFNRMETLGPVLEAVGERPGFGILWDLAHSDRAYGDDWEPFYGLIRPWIRHVHTKDHVRADDYRLVQPGAGDIPVARIASRLVADGYDGWFSLEWERAWHPELPSLAEALPLFVADFAGV